MTLIAAFQCEQGVVLCADSQETIDIPERGSYRVNVNKLEQRDAGKYEVIVGGAGDGALVDGFVDQFVEMVSRWRNEYRESQALSAIRRFVRDYHATDIALSPAHPDDKHLGFVVCLRSKNTRNISLWKIIELHVRSIPDLTLLGWEEALYWREAKRLYHLSGLPVAKPSSSEAILLGVHLFSIAKETSNVISGDTQVILISGDGVHIINPNDVKELEGRITTFERLSSWIFLALPDVAVSRTRLNQYLADFKKIALELHDDFTFHIVQTWFERLKASPNYPNIAEAPQDPYLQLPTLEEIQQDLCEDENIIAIRKRVDAYTRQAEAEIGWEQFADAKPRQLIADLHGAVVGLSKSAKLNRALYEGGKYGQVGSEEAAMLRQEVARIIDVASSELTGFLKSVPKAD